MEPRPKEMQEIMDFRNDPSTDELAKEIAITALISVVKEKEDYSSGPDFPNIPFGD